MVKFTFPVFKNSKLMNNDIHIGSIIKQNDKIAHAHKTIFIAVEVEADSLQQLTLPNDFIHLIKK